MKKKVLRERNKKLNEKYWGQYIEKKTKSFLKSIDYLSEEKTKTEKTKNKTKKEDK